MHNELQVVTETSIYYNGRKYSKKPTGYYYNCSTRKHLHQAIWVDNNGPIPEGYEIHHVDFNNQNNDLSNLVCIPRSEHKKLHADALTDERRQQMRENLSKNALPKASEWHKSDEGRKWHSDHAKNMAINGKSAFNKKENLICSCCGKSYVGVRNHTKKNAENNTFCSNACKSRYLRHKRAADKSEKRVCVICGKEFMSSPWSKSKTCSRSCAVSLRAKNMKKVSD